MQRLEIKRDPPTLCNVRMVQQIQESPPGPPHPPTTSQPHCALCVLCCRASSSVALLFTAYVLHQRLRPFLVSSSISDTFAVDLEERLGRNRALARDAAASLRSGRTVRRRRGGGSQSVPRAVPAPASHDSTPGQSSGPSSLSNAAHTTVRMLAVRMNYNHLVGSN